MGKNQGRSGDDTSKAGEQTFVQASKQDPPGSASVLQESFLQQVTGASARGKSTPRLHRSKAAPASSSKGPIAAGDVLAASQTSHASLPDFDWSLPELPTMSEELHPSTPSWPVAPTKAKPQTLSSTNELEPPTPVDIPSLLDLEEDAPESTDAIEQFHAAKAEMSSPKAHTSVSRTADFPNASKPSSPFDQDNQVQKKKSYFDSFSEDADASSTSMDPIPAYLRAAIHTSSRSGEHSSAVIQSNRRGEPASGYRTARSIHLEPLEPQHTQPPVRRIHQQQTMQRATATPHFPLQMPVYSHAASGHSVFMYRPRIPSLRWVKVDDTAFRITELTEQLEEYAPWIVATLFLIAACLAVFILLSI